MRPDIGLSTEAEARARSAEEFPAFAGTALVHIKRQVALLLDQIGRRGFFEHYTRHNIEHVDRMLRSLEWIIPDKTKDLMTPADWLLTVLAIYLHDLGMLVTPDEFDHRHESMFVEYRNRVFVPADDDATDYRAKIFDLPPDDAERFLYQEFVRERHAERIRRWIEGSPATELGRSSQVADELQNLFNHFGHRFKVDLALVCESHHRDDLDDLERYPVVRPYGVSDEETANVQFAAILLRTADLLHITLDRTPSIVFRILNPKDPLTQREWAKQMAVRRVLPRPAMDREGNVDAAAESDTIEVHATFDDENGFFGLTAYLSYAEEQLRQSQQWVAAASATRGAHHRFPWRYIDQSNIETIGFIPRQYSFEIDQERILDLLTGHTLYNDTRVVLRELVQNSIDAVRLQFGRDDAATFGRVMIEWNDKTRVLTVRDNGTGMTQEIIEQNLLRVGASRYRDERFVEQHPEFSPISRFGIGILSAFMIADAVDITTSHPDEEHARHLSLRSVHGKYLIRLLNKEGDERARQIGPHGTEVRLHVRPSARVDDVVATARLWVVLPGCHVHVTVGNNSDVTIGYDTPGDALKAALIEDGVLSSEGVSMHSGTPIDVVEAEGDGLVVAFAVEWSTDFREWEFIPADAPRESAPLGICVQGIRVEFGTPGYRDRQIYAIANASGRAAPQTNVARVGLEDTEERAALLRAIYDAYLRHIEKQMKDLEQERGYSLTGAAGEARYLLNPLVQRFGRTGRVALADEAMFFDRLCQLSALVLEDGDCRRRVCVSDVVSTPDVWTLDSGLTDHAESLLMEVHGHATLRQLIRAVTGDSFALPKGNILSMQYVATSLRDEFTKRFEVCELVANAHQRRLDVRWSLKQTPPRWTTPAVENLASPPWLSDIYRKVRSSYDREAQLRNLHIPVGEVVIRGLNDEDAIRLESDIYLRPGAVITSALIEEGAPTRLTTTGLVLALVTLIRHSFIWEADDYMQAIRVRAESSSDVDNAKLHRVLAGARWRLFDTRSWRRAAPE